MINYSGCAYLILRLENAFFLYKNILVIPFQLWLRCKTGTQLVLFGVNRRRKEFPTSTVVALHHM